VSDLATSYSRPELFLSAYAALGDRKVVAYGGLIPTLGGGWETVGYSYFHVGAGLLLYVVQSRELWLGELDGLTLTWTMLVTNQIEPRFGSYAATFKYT
jgi:hypothetical protein